MCGFVADIVDFETLSVAKKKALKKELERRKQALQTRVSELDRALKAFNKKAKRAKR